MPLKMVAKHISFLHPLIHPRPSLSFSRHATVKEGTVFGGTAEIRGDSSHGPISEDDLRHRPSLPAPPACLLASLAHTLTLSRVDDDGVTKCAITEKQAG